MPEHLPFLAESGNSETTVSRVQPEQAGRRAGALDRWLLSRIARRAMGSAPARLVLWDGSEERSSQDPPAFTVVFGDRRTLFRLAMDPDHHFGDAFASGALEVRGDLVAALEAVFRAREAASTNRSVFRRLALPRLGSSRSDIHHHYDLGNDFYRLWLDREMLYTCAYYPSPSVDLDAAQQAKMEHVCRKLALRPGETVVEAGCGWGAFALYMARRHGVTVKAYNLSREQVRYAHRRAAEEGLADRVAFIEDDYRNIRGRFDAFVSVGMLEHVGLANYRTLGAVIDRSLDDKHGRGLLHFIGRNRPAPLNAWIRDRIFPGAYPPTLAEVTGQVLAPFDFAVLDVENLRLHYARTLEHWRTRFEAAATTVSERHGSEFMRAWRLYLAGSEAGFRAGTLQLFQVRFARGCDNGVPWTRPV